MDNNILDKIIDKKLQRLDEIKKKISLESLIEKVKNNLSSINFKEKINKNLIKNKISVIGEIKRSSPSAGIIIKNYDPVDIAKQYYKNKITCLSVLTEEDYFQGSLIHLYNIKQKIKLPILCKDFFIDPYQVYLSKTYGADAILIILAANSEKLAHRLYEKALDLNMSVIVEVHDKEEAKNSLKFKDALIGINNRNLKTLETNINTTYDIHDILINHKGPIISESGFENKNQILDISKKTKIKTFLIGESLLKNLDKSSIFSLLT
jgi:indole-3-glycerol phosphate synthase